MKIFAIPRWLRTRASQWARKVGPAIDGRARPDDRFGLVDLLGETVADVSARPIRLIATTAGTIFGVGALVATIGFSQTSSAQIAEQFNAVAGRQAIVAPATEKTADGKDTPLTDLDWDAATRLTRISGVEDAALVSELQLGDRVVSAVNVDDPTATIPQQPHVYAGSAELIAATGGSLVSGRMFDEGHDERGARVAVVSSRVATRLSIGDISTQPSIFLGDTAYSVIGVYDDTRWAGELMDAVIIPSGTARSDFALTSPSEVRVLLSAGSGPVLTQQAPIALEPGQPDLITISAPAGASDLQKNVQSGVSLIFVVLSIVVLLAGGFGIANVTMLSVMERTAEIGLRRAVGATRRQIAAQFIAESVVIGLLGGLLGSGLGVVAIEVFAVVQHWTAVTSPILAMGGILVGALIGLLAGGLPARRAAKIEPIDALRGD